MSSLAAPGRVRRTGAKQPAQDPDSSVTLALVTTTRVSVSSEGDEGNLWSYGGSISADGRYVAFQSYASNLVDFDMNGDAGAFVRDRGGGGGSAMNFSPFSSTSRKGGDS